MIDDFLITAHSDTGESEPALTTITNLNQTPQHPSIPPTVPFTSPFLNMSIEQVAGTMQGYLNSSFNYIVILDDRTLRDSTVLLVVDHGDDYGVDPADDDPEYPVTEGRYRIASVRSTLGLAESSIVAWSVGCEALEEGAEIAEDGGFGVLGIDNETDARRKLRPPPSFRN